jgi:uncharacterized phiE125 gp8 family phage protein
MSSLKLITPPTAEPITLDEAKAQCRIIYPDEDALVAGYILRARDYVETFLRRSLMPTTWEVTFDFDWPEDESCERDKILLPRPPLQSVTSVKYIDLSGVEQTLASNQYRVVGAGDREKEAFIVPAYLVVWPLTRDDYDCVTVRYVAGYTQVPEAIKQALLLLVEHYYSTRGPLMLGFSGSEVPHSVNSLLFPWRSFY